MKFTGHKTEAVYRRYAIAAEVDLREGVAKLAALKRGEQQGRSFRFPGQRRRAPECLSFSQNTDRTRTIPGAWAWRAKGRFHKYWRGRMGIEPTYRVVRTARWI